MTGQTKQALTEDVADTSASNATTSTRSRSVTKRTTAPIMTAITMRMSGVTVVTLTLGSDCGVYE
jgi:hypothetical protein